MFLVYVGDPCAKLYQSLVKCLRKRICKIFFFKGRKILLILPCAVDILCNSDVLYGTDKYIYIMDNRPDKDIANLIVLFLSIV